MKLTRLKSNRPRREHDFYPTPFGLAKAALERFKQDYHIQTPWEILDVGCGQGIWMMAAEQVWDTNLIATYGIDIDPQIEGTVNKDFLISDYEDFDYNHFRLVYGNPPYSLMEEFIRHALNADLLKKDGYVFFLGRLEFLASQKRSKGLFAEFPLRHVYILSRRPSFFSTNGHKTTDAQDYAMYLWQEGYKGDTRLGWLNWEYDIVVDYEKFESD